MSFDVNEFVSEVDPENLDDNIVDGLYHIQIHSVDDSEPDFIKVDYEVLGGNQPDQEGKTNSERIYTRTKEGKASPRIAFFLLATKLTTIDQMIDAKNGKKHAPIDLADAEGRQICVEIKKNKSGYIQWTYKGIWSVDSEEAKDVPKNDGMLSAATSGDGDGEVPF